MNLHETNKELFLVKLEKKLVSRAKLHHSTNRFYFDTVDVETVIQDIKEVIEHNNLIINTNG